MYYPKYKKQATEATISWDVAGYYLYLPAMFIYKDLKQLAFEPELRKKYNFSPNSDSYYEVENGNKVLKYSIGMAVLYSPAFIIANIFTLITDYPSDGYSLPYQLALFIQGFIVLFLGFFYLRKLLLKFFSDGIVAWTLLVIGLCTNLLEYGAITNAMAHNYLFTGYSLLLWNTFKIGQSNSTKYYLSSGLIIGLMALARPTEIISILIPASYLILVHKNNIIKYLKDNYLKLGLTILIIGCIGFIQILYWIYISGKPIQYSYQEQGFSWLHPHLIDGFFSFKAGWLVYTPVMSLSLVGFLFIKGKSKKWRYPLILFTLLFIYIAFAWDIWWYGGSLGQRTMIQIFPVLAIPLASFLAFSQNKWINIITMAFIGICGFLNAWLVHQAHHGGLLKAGEMTQPYYLATVGRKVVKDDITKLLDAQYIHREIINAEVPLLAVNDTICLNKDIQSIPPKSIPVSNDYKFIRIYVDFDINEIEWEKWRWTQLIAQYKQNGNLLQTDMLRIQRLRNIQGENSTYLDTKVPNGAENIEVSLWHADSQKQLCVKNIKIVLLK